MSFLTKRITCLNRPIIQSFNYEISLQGSIPKYSLFTCVDRSASATAVGADGQGVLKNSIPPIFVPSQYGSTGSYEICWKAQANAGAYPTCPLGMYGITHRFCPEMSQFLLNATSLLFPGPAGMGQCSGAILYDYAAKAMKIKHKYPMRRFFCDKFFLPVIYGSQDLNRVDEEYDIQGTNIRAQG